MKAIYLKPTTEEIRLSLSAIMITVSGGKDGQIVEDGGSTNENNITEGDSRRRTVWDDEEEEDLYY